MKLENGKTVEGDILDMANEYAVLSSTEAWIIGQMADEIKRLRSDVEQLQDRLGQHCP